MNYPNQETHLKKYQSMSDVDFNTRMMQLESTLNMGFDPKDISW